MMKKNQIIGLLAFVCVALTTGTAYAASFTITWKNQFQTSSCTQLEVEVKSIMGDISGRDTNKLSFNEIRTMTVNSSACSGIELVANCTYSDNGVIKQVSMRATAQCGDSTAEIVGPGNINVQTLRVNSICRPWCTE
jgi:hypothetical protein